MTDDTASGSITDEDVGLPVLDGEGNQIGVLADAADGDVTIDPDPDVSDDARASLGWNPSDDAAQTLDASELERVDGEDVPDAFPKTALGRDREAGEGGVGPRRPTGSRQQEQRRVAGAAGQERDEPAIAFAR